MQRQRGRIDGPVQARGRVTASEGREQELPTLSRLPYLCKQPCVYDTRYDDWARTLATLGAEVTMTDHFRYEVYIAR